MSQPSYLDLIPNRPPYLWVDEVVAVDEQSIHTRKFVDPKLELFAGHYPGFSGCAAVRVRVPGIGDSGCETGRLDG
jgi:3-hydroxymyristoyl/3-hydroxydecanoyl-(acyl carrier protein) dehydratase